MLELNTSHSTPSLLHHYGTSSYKVQQYDTTHVNTGGSAREMITYFEENSIIHVGANVTDPMNWTVNVTETTDRNIALVALQVIPMIVIMLSAIFGNSLVIVSIFKFRKLRTLTNHFIVSMAFADMLVAILVMPFNASRTIAGKWVFNRVFCDIFNSNDVLFSTASLQHICCISLDRYIAILHPLKYDRLMSRKNVIIILCMTWGTSSLISYIPIHLGWYTTRGHYQYSINHPDECDFIVSRLYCAISSSVSFWIPCFFMLFAYHKIYKEASRQERQLSALSKYMKLKGMAKSDSVSGSIHSSGERRVSPRDSPPSSQRYCQKTSHRLSTNLAIPPDLPSGLGGECNIPVGRCNSTGSQYSPISPKRQNGESRGSRIFSRFNRNQGLCSSQGRQKMRREHKAAKTLGIIMGCFLLCWLPFFLWYVISTMCGDELCPVPEAIVTILFWIGYFNSSLNPLIYAFFNREFRSAFKKLLGCNRRDQRHMWASHSSSLDAIRPQFDRVATSPPLSPTGTPCTKTKNSIGGSKTEPANNNRFSLSSKQPNPADV